MQHETKLFVFSAGAILTPFLCSTFAVLLTRGVSFGSRAVDLTVNVIVIAAGLPFVMALPISPWRKIIFGTFVVLLGFLFCFVWSLWLSCAAFGSCL
jgi:hypothetical protein